MIYFDKDKKAYGYEIENYIAKIEDDIWMKYSATDKWDIIEGKFVDISDTNEYKEKKQKEERERINKLSLTAADVERAIYNAKNMDFEDILEMVKDNPEINLKALKIELKANNFYRGNPYINQIGMILGFTTEMLDEFFETNDYTKLLNIEEPKEATNEEIIANPKD